MQRTVAFLLVPILVATMPIWPFNHQWGYGPAFVIAFLLAVNVLVLVIEYVGRRLDGSLPEYRRMPANIAVTPNPGARHAEGVKAAEIAPAGRR